MDAVFKTGSKINVLVEFSEPVFVIENPLFQLFINQNNIVTFPIEAIFSTADNNSNINSTLNSNNKVLFEIPLDESKLTLEGNLECTVKSTIQLNNENIYRSSNFQPLQKTDLSLRQT
jgi:hypothetical protein